jgi:opacity protein-like surface antigen
MKKTIVALTAAAALSGAAIQPAAAHPAWLLPVLIGAGAATVVVGGAAIANANGPHGTVFVQPYSGGPGCRVAQQQNPDGTWRNVRICG